LALSKKVFCWVGWTVETVSEYSYGPAQEPEKKALPVLMLPNDRPTSPSLAPERNWSEALEAISTACDLTVVPPMVTVSVPTVPEDPLPSAYWIDQVAPESSFQVVLLEGSKTLWFFCEAAGRLVEKTQLQMYELLYSIHNLGQ
jgi:hypothetical protein